MTGLEALQSVQYVTIKDRQFAVLSLDDWESLIEWLEELEDLDVVQEALGQLASAEGNPERAGWLRWQDVRDELV